MEAVGRLIHGSCREADTWKLSGDCYMEAVGRLIHGSCREGDKWKLSGG
jgi:hypothetical protein